MHTNEPMTSSEHEPPSHPLAPVAVPGVYQRGVVRPNEPLDLPDGSPVLIVAVAEQGATMPTAPTSRWTLPYLGASQQAALARFVDTWRIALITLALGFALVAQARFLDLRSVDVVAVLSGFLAAPLLWLALYGVDRAPLRIGPPPNEPISPAVGPWRGARVVLLTASALSALVLLAGLAQTSLPGGYNPLFLFWLMTIGFGLAAFTPWPLTMPPRPDLIALRHALPIAGITLVALGVRVWQIGSIPGTLGGDEGSQGLEAIRVLNGTINNPFTTGWLGVPTMSFYFNAPSIAFFGHTMFALRLPWAFVGAATVLVTYLLVARLHGQVLGLISAGFLAGFHYHIHFARLGSNQIADAFFVALALLALYRGYDRRSPLFWALSGAVIGVSQFFYAGARFTAIVVVVCVIVFMLRDGPRFWREQRMGLLALIWVGLVSAGPMIQYAIRFPTDYNARINMVGIVQSGWLEREQIIRETGALPILVDQFWRAALLYNAYPDRTIWYGSPAPLFNLIEGAFFIIGLGYSLLHLADRRHFPMVAWWGGAVIMGGMLTESPPSLQRLITTAVPAAFFLGLGMLLSLRALWALLNRGDGRSLRTALAVLTLVLALVSTRYYFVEFSPKRIYGGPNAMVATSLAEYVQRELDPETRVVFFGPPRMYYSFGSLPYLVGRDQGVDVRETLTGPPPADLAAPGDDVVFVFLPERLGELALVQTVFPNGTLEAIPSPISDDTLYSVYRP
jgi:4-amino-4-deoxy-L-arabinose transferase-like glycosyltransferase